MMQYYRTAFDRALPVAKLGRMDSIELSALAEVYPQQAVGSLSPTAPLLTGEGGAAVRRGVWTREGPALLYGGGWEGGSFCQRLFPSQFKEVKLPGVSV
jgi:hypothetical protein